MSIRSLTAVQLGKKIQAGEVTVREAVEASLAPVSYTHLAIALITNGKVNAA